MLLKQITQLESDGTEYPFQLYDFDLLTFEYPVTFFTGSNGSGKSTLLRIIKELAETLDIGEGRGFSPEVRDELPNFFKLSWQHKNKRGFYLQSEDFYEYLNRANREMIFYEEELKQVEAKHENKQSMGYLLEAGLQQSNRKRFEKIDKEMGEASHGEGYLAFFKSRLHPNSLYLLDEPETPLSFQNQLALLVMIDDAVKQGCQFIICTHSPVLLAYPESNIYHFDDGIKSINLEDHPIVNDWQSFMLDPKRYMHYLLLEQKK